MAWLQKPYISNNFFFHCLLSAHVTVDDHPAMPSFSFHFISHFSSMHEFIDNTTFQKVMDTREWWKERVLLFQGASETREQSSDRERRRWRKPDRWIDIIFFLIFTCLVLSYTKSSLSHHAFHLVHHISLVQRKGLPKKVMKYRRKSRSQS